MLVLARDHRLYALYVLALYLGLRRGELLGLRWTDVDSAAGVLQVRQSLQRIGGELRAVTPKTRSSRRTVPLIGVGVDALHSDIDVTMTIYAHVSLDDKRAALGKLDEHLR